LRPQRIRATFEPWCFDDWCLQVQKVDSAPAGAKIAYAIKLRVYSTARRATQRANGAWIYLLDERHRLYGTAVRSTSCSSLRPRACSTGPR
jgi:hypothetical protein